MKKKMMALLLALAMLLGLSPALAAEGGYFNDEKDITHLAAASNLVRLKVLWGKDDGSIFDPKGTVTRGEAARCVAYLLLGSDPADLPAPSSASPSFPDIEGHWAETYIEYCAEKGAAFPQEDSNFDPNGAVTEFELLRMLEVALGEVPSQFGKADNWIVMTHALAIHHGLFTGLDDFAGKAITDQPLTRDEAAQLLYNALNATPKFIGPSGFYEDVKRPDGTPSTLLYENFGYASWDDVPAPPAIGKAEEPKPTAPKGIDPTALTDAKDITHWDAVASLCQLGIINGKDDGAFHPTESVTRAEAAKMIAVIMNGGSEANTGAKKEPTFTDIQGHWAEGHIEYCADMAIVSGDGRGTFDPEGQVSVIQMYKMALTALGYDPEAYALVGSRWASMTFERAKNSSGRKLTEGLRNEGLDGKGEDQPASREVVAQILYNTLLATPIVAVPDGRNADGTVVWKFQPAADRSSGQPETLLHQRFNMAALPASVDKPVK